MKLRVTAVNCKRLVLFVGVCALIFVQQSTGMMPSKKHQAIAFNRAQAAKARSMKDPIWVKTTEGHIVAIEKWKIDQMKVLQVMLVHQKGSNSQHKAVDGSEVISFNELNLLSNALDAASMGQFEEFYTNIGDADTVRMLINAAGEVEATGLSALCGTYFFPKDIQSLIAVDLVRPVIRYIGTRIKPKDLARYPFPDNSIVSPDGKKIVRIQSLGIFPDRRLMVWDAETGKQLFSLVGHQHSINVVAFSPDGKKIVSGSMSNQNNLLVWDAVAGKQLFSLVGHQKAINAVAFSPDSKKIVSGGGGNQNNLIVWDAETGKQLFNLAGHAESVFSVAFSSDGTKIISRDLPNNLLVWELPIDLINTIENNLNISQVRLLYQMYCAAASGITMTIKIGSSEEKIYHTLPDDVKKAAVEIFGVNVEKDFS